MKNFILFVSLLSFSLFALEEVHHPVPKEPVYVTQEWYSELRKELPAPPQKGSPAQQKDEAGLISAQKSRSAADCARAKSEVMVSVQSFYGAPYGPLSSAQVTKLNAFFEQTRNDADFFIQQLKKEFPRPRPFKYVKGLEPCVSLEVTNAYPSGHAVLAQLYGRILSDFFPKQKKAIMKRAGEIAQDRVVSGMHHPSDIEVGKSIGNVIYGKFKQSKQFQTAVLKAR